MRYFNISKRTMPGRESQEKKVIRIIRTIQERIEVFSDDGQDTRTGVINDGAYLELSNLNRDLFNSVKGVENENIYLRGRVESLRTQLMFLTSQVMLVKKTDWWMKNTDDPDYTKRQVMTRQEKIDSPNHTLCECGDWVSHRNRSYLESHRKTEKCNSNRMRIKYEKGKMKFGMRLDILLLMDGHLRIKIGQGSIHNRHITGMGAIWNLLEKFSDNRIRCGYYL